MEPVTHVLTGMCLARAGFHRRVRYATAAMGIAAEFPDIDTLWSLRGPISGFQHHRGITHTFVGIPFEAAALFALFWGLDLFLDRRKPERRAAAGQRPRRWGGLYGCLVLALLSHLLLDYTNNYGLRPFLPFNDRWYMASIVFIFDPLIFISLLAGLLLPVLFKLVNQEVSGQRARVQNPGWSRAALLVLVAIWLLRWHEHQSALALAAQQTFREPAQILPATGYDPNVIEEAQIRPLLPPQKITASPDPLNPFRWYLATDFGPIYELGTADTRSGSLIPGAVLNKSVANHAVRQAKESRLGRIYLDWSAMPWISTVPDGVASGTGRAEPEAETEVFLEDLRFRGTSPFLQRGSEPPLTGQVIVGKRGEVTGEGLDGRFEH